MATYGRQIISDQGGTDLHVNADGFPDWHPIGITIDWSTVAAVSGSDATYLDGTVVKVGAKGLPLGTVLTKITASGKYGPYDSGASDGRQTLSRGNCVILDMSVVEAPVGGLVAGPTDHPPVIEGGLVWRERLQIGGAGQPSVANFEAAFPRIRYVVS